MVPQKLTVEQKLGLFRKLVPCGMKRLEITSFSNPKWVPQFADTDEFCEKLFSECKQELPELMAFVPNVKGLDRLLAHPIEWVSGFVSVSESFSKKNINMSVAEAIEAVGTVVEKAHHADRKVRVYISAVFGCPYEGKIALEQVLSVTKKVIDFRPDEIAFGDLIGVACPSQVAALVELVAPLFALDKVALHFHNTYGLALPSIAEAVSRGVRHFDASMGGLGGCPYAKGASGNVATDELMYFFHREERHLPTDWPAVEQALHYLDNELGLSVQSRLYEILKRGGKLYAVEP